MFILSLFGKIKDALIGVGGFFLDLIPGIKPFDVLTVPELFNDIVNSVKFFLPMDDIFQIFVLSTVITMLRISLSILRLFKEFVGTIIEKIF